MDQALKDSMDNILRMAAPKQSQENTTISPPSWQRPSEEEIKGKVDKFLKKSIDGSIPYRLRNAEKELLGMSVNWDDGLFITGPAGTGKSYMAAAILKDRIYSDALKHYQELYYGKEKHGPQFALDRSSKSWEWITVPELLLSLRSSFKDKSDETEEGIIRQYSRVEWLILDDLGAEKSSEFTIQSLYLIIDRRYSEMRPTIITSNLSLGEISEKVGDRIASRIAGMCKVVELKGKDRRLG